MLKSESFNVYTTDLGEEGVDLGKLYDYDIILLDLNLPDMSGYEVLRSLRVSKVKTPILILTGLGGIEDKVRGLGFGADDYMTKPFHKDELVARIHAIVRRSKGHAESVINTGDLCVNLDAKTVKIGGAHVHLTPKEYQILELLSLRKGTTLTKEMFLNNLYGGMDEPEIKIIDVFICKLRKKLANASDGKDYIETVWGRGYVCCASRARMASGLKSAISASLHALIVAFRKVARAMTPVGCRPSVGSSRSIFGHHPAQPIYVPQCNVCPWKRTGDAAFVKGVEDGDPQIGARATAVVKVDKRIELEFETVRPERFELDRRRRRRHHIRIALRNV